VNDYFADRAESVARATRAEGGKAEPVSLDVKAYEMVHDAVSAVPVNGGYTLAL